MDQAPRALRAGIVLGWALAFGLVVDTWAEGPPGLGVVVAAAVAAVGLVAAARPSRSSIAFLAAALLLTSFAVVRASPILIAFDLLAAVGLFALAGAFAREGDPLRTGLRAYLARGVAWIGTLPRAAAFGAAPVARLVPRGRHVSPTVPRAVALSVTVGLAFVLLLGSADVVFAELLRAPFREVSFGELPGHLVVVGAAGAAFVTLAVRASGQVRLGSIAEPIAGGGLRPGEWISLLVTVDIVFALFVGVQLLTFFGGRRHVMAEAGLTFAEYARAGFWQMLIAASLTGAVIAAAWIGGRPAGRHRRRFVVLATVLVVLSLVVLASAFHRLVLYEATFGYTWPRLIPHVAILLTGALLVCGLVAVLTGGSAWLATAALGLGFAALLGLNALDPDAFIADRNLARAEGGLPLDPWELNSLSADAVPTIVEALPSLDQATRSVIERDLSCLREDLRDGVARFGWGSFNVARDVALERLNPLRLPAC